MIGTVPLACVGVLTACHGIVRGGRMVTRSDGARALRRGFKSVADYRAAKARAHGFNSWEAYQADLAIRSAYHFE